MTKHIHFVGINGSGISGAACIAARNGYKVSGCDGKAASNYSVQFQDLGIEPMLGHDVSHLDDNVDMVVITPHFLYKDLYKNIPELVEAKDRDILIKWQEFMGKYIMPQKNSIAVCGTHGKTTTTSLIGICLEQAGVDPTVLVGGIVPKWNRTFRTGNSDCYVIEADEYDNNFIHYNPKYVVFNSLEMEHPEIFASFSEYRQVFMNFLKTIQENGYLLFNMDVQNVCDAVEEIRDFCAAKNVKLIGYGINNQDFKCDKKYYASDVNLQNHTSFKIGESEYQTDMIGLHNVYNLLACYSVCHEVVGGDFDFQKSIEGFCGAKRRLEVVLENDNVKLYNDYAHHHNQVKSNLEAIKCAYPSNKIIAVLEPHQISRLTENTKEYMDAMNIADEFYISEIFKGREKDKEIPDVDAMIAPYKTKGAYKPNRDELVANVIKSVKENPEKTLVVVMGAGDSYKITEALESELK